MMARRVGLLKSYNNFGKQTFSLYTIITLYTDFSAFRLENIDSQPQIPAEEATIEGRNVRPGLCPKRIMHETMLRIFYSLLFSLYTIYILNFSTLHCMSNCVAI